MKNTKRTKTQLKSLHHLCMSIVMLDNTLKIVAPKVFTKEEILSMNEHLSGIMQVLLDKGEELKI
jgi:hypothetical protein